jgi:hypothetical protein
MGNEPQDSQPAHLATDAHVEQAVVWFRFGRDEEPTTL